MARSDDDDEDDDDMEVEEESQVQVRDQTWEGGEGRQETRHSNPPVFFQPRSFPHHCPGPALVPPVFPTGLESAGVSLTGWHRNEGHLASGKVVCPHSSSLSEDGWLSAGGPVFQMPDAATTPVVPRSRWRRRRQSRGPSLRAPIERW